MKTMFTADGFFIVLLMVAVYIGLKWHTHAKLKKIIKDGEFVFKGKQYEVYCIGRPDDPGLGLPEALLGPDNGAFAPDTLSKVKFLKECDKQTLSTMKDDLALQPKRIYPNENILSESDEMHFNSE